MTPSLDNGYQLTLESVGPPVADREVEPNDVIAAASTWDPAVVIQGRADGEDDDYFHATIAGDPQLWRLDATGTGIEQRGLGPTLVSQTLATATVAADGTSATMTDLYLIPGDHWFHVAAHVTVPTPSS